MNRYSLPDYAAVKDRLAPMPGDDPVAAYENGFVGAYYDGEEHEKLQSLVRSEGLPWSAEAVTYGGGFAGQGSGKAILLYKEAERPGWLAKLGYPNQTEGSCVAHATSKVMGLAICVAVNHGQGSYPETGGIEGKMWPVSPCPHYWYRSNARENGGGDGWYAAASLRVTKEHVGVVICKDYTSAGGIDLREYNTHAAHRYSASTVPSSFLKAIDGHRVMTYTECSTYEEIIDMLSAGAPVQTDGGEGFAKETDEFGVARRSGSWAHSMTVTGYIDTTAFKAKYGCGGLIISNSWGAWVKNSHATVMGTGQKLPAGSFIALWKDVTRRQYFAVSAVQGWPNRRLRDWSIVAKGLI